MPGNEVESRAESGRTLTLPSDDAYTIDPPILEDDDDDEDDDEDEV